MPLHPLAADCPERPEGLAAGINLAQLPEATLAAKSTGDKVNGACMSTGHQSASWTPGGVPCQRVMAGPGSSPSHITTRAAISRTMSWADCGLV